MSGGVPGMGNIFEPWSEPGLAGSIIPPKSRVTLGNIPVAGPMLSSAPPRPRLQAGGPGEPGWMVGGPRGAPPRGWDGGGQGAPPPTHAGPARGRAGAPP